MKSRHCGQDKRILFCPVHNASTPCLLLAFGIRCIIYIYRDYCLRHWTMHLQSTREVSNGESSYNNLPRASSSC